MNSTVTTFILVIVIVGLTLGVFTYASFESSIFSGNTNAVKVAQSYSSEIQTFTSQPAVKFIIPTSPGIPLNYSVNYIITFSIPSYSGYLIIFPFITSSKVNLATYDPFSVNQVSNPNYVGYIKITSVNPLVQIIPISLNNQVVYASNNLQLQVTGIAYKVPNGRPLNITYVTNSSASLVIWVIANISGQLYRIAYPVFPLPQGIISEEGLVNFPPTTISYYQYLQQLFGEYSQIYYLSGVLPLTFNGYTILNASGSAIGFFSNSPQEIIFNGHTQLIGNYWAYSNSITILQNGYLSAPPSISVNSYPSVRISVIEKPILSQFQGVQFVINNSPSVIFNGNTKKTFTSPIIFEGSVTFNGISEIVFESPVIFKGDVTFNGQSQVIFYGPVIFEGQVIFNGNSNITSTKGIIFNGTQVIFNGQTKNTIGGPVIFDTSQSVIFNGNSQVLVEGPIAIQSPQIVFNGQSSLISYEYTIFYSNPTFNGGSYIGTIHKIPPVNISLTVTQSSLYTLNGNTNQIQAWFKVIPNNTVSTILNFTIYNTSMQSYIIATISPLNTQTAQFTMYLIQGSSLKQILTANLNYYSWYYITITLIFPNTVSAALYSTSSLVSSGQLSSISLPINSNVKLFIGNEMYSQVLFISESISATPPSIYGNGQGYLTNYTYSLSQYSWQSGQIGIYYYILTNTPQNIVNPSFIYPQTYYGKFALIVQQSLGVSP